MQVCPKCGNVMEDYEHYCPKCHEPNQFYLAQKKKRISRQKEAFASEQERLKKLYYEQKAKEQGGKKEDFDHEQERLKKLYYEQKAKEQGGKKEDFDHEQERLKKLYYEQKAQMQGRKKEDFASEQERLKKLYYEQKAKEQGKKKEDFASEQERLKRMYYEQQKQEQQRGVPKREYVKPGAYDNQKKPRKSKWGVAMVSFAACLVLVFGLGIFMMNSDTEEQNTEQKTNVASREQQNYEESDSSSESGDADVQEDSSLSDAGVQDGQGDTEDTGQNNTEDIRQDDAGGAGQEGAGDTDRDDAESAGGAPVVEQNMKNKKKHTIMMYVVGSDLESSGGCVSTDLKEIENSGVNTGDVNYLVYAGGTRLWHNGLSSEHNSILYLKKSGFAVKKQGEQKNMGNPSTLTNFIDYCFKNYPADQYHLVFWDHGGGPVDGFGVDENYGDDSLSTDEMETAVRDSSVHQSSYKFETVIYDACLMGSAELANMWKNYANYLIASENIISAEGFNYNYLTVFHKNGINGAGIGKQAVDDTFQFYKKCKKRAPYDAKYQDFTFSCIDLSKIDELTDCVDVLFSSVGQDVNRRFRELLVQRKKVKEYRDRGLVDLYEVADKLKKEYGKQAENLENSIKQAVVHRKSLDGRDHGMTVYYPYKKNMYNAEYSSLNFPESYKQYVSDFYSESSSSSRAMKWDKNMIPKVKRKSGGQYHVSLKLSEEQFSFYDSAAMYVLKPSSKKKGTYAIAGGGSDIKIKDGVLSANTDTEMVQITDSKGQTHDVQLVYLKESKEGKVYMATAILHRMETESDGKKKKVSVKVNVEILQDKKSDVCYIRSITPAEPETPMQAFRSDFKLEDWDTVEFGYLYKKAKRGSDGVWEPITEWKSTGEFEGVEMVTTGDNEFEMKNLSDNKGYYVCFAVTDDSGQVHMSEMRKMK